MYKGPLGVHEVEFVIQTGPSLHNCSCVAQTAHGTMDLGKVTTGHNSWRLVVDSNLEPSRTPVDKLDETRGLDPCDCSIDILGDNITTVEEADRHVFPLLGIAFHHLTVSVKAGSCDFSNRKSLVISLKNRLDSQNLSYWEKAFFDIPLWPKPPVRKWRGDSVFSDMERD